MHDSSSSSSGRVQVGWTHLVAVGLVVAGLLSACGSHTDSHDHDPGHNHDHGHDDHVHIDPVEQDPAVAATSALTVLFSWDPARQSGPGDVPSGVADELFTGALAADVRSGGAVVDRPEQWGDWATAQARVSALVPQTRVSDTGDERSRVVAAQVAQTLVYPDGGRSRLPGRQVRVHLVLVEGRWKADRVDVADADQQQQQQQSGDR
ncbi:hypothetical protein [Corynebacterium bovis]|uniref:hypothetical protein n=1 Tax=Corynebacterium bovis TaxID=36808 RepID=UPI000F64A7EC|nr:hypothetical protein [Corynebacterium bovis]